MKEEEKIIIYHIKNTIRRCKGFRLIIGYLIKPYASKGGSSHICHYFLNVMGEYDELEQGEKNEFLTLNFF